MYLTDAAIVVFFCIITSGLIYPDISGCQQNFLKKFFSFLRRAKLNNNNGLISDKKDDFQNLLFFSLVDIIMSTACHKFTAAVYQHLS